MNFYKERTFQEIFTDTFVFLRQEWRTVFLCIAIYVAPISALAHYLSFQVTDILNVASREMLIFLLFSLISNFLLQSITYCYIACRVKNNEIPTRQTVMEFFSKNILTCIKAFLISNLGIGIGFMLLVIPGLIALAPLSLFMFDKILTGASTSESFNRSVQIAKSNAGMSYAIVLLSYMALFFIQSLIGTFTAEFSAGAQILINVTFTIASAIVYIIIAFLYFSLHSKIQKSYDNY